MSCETNEAIPIKVELSGADIELGRYCTQQNWWSYQTRLPFCVIYFFLISRPEHFTLTDEDHFEVVECCPSKYFGLLFGVFPLELFYAAHKKLGFFILQLQSHILCNDHTLCRLTWGVSTGLWLLSHNIVSQEPSFHCDRPSNQWGERILSLGFSQNGSRSGKVICCFLLDLGVLG